jgi:hypothetical protein
MSIKAKVLGGNDNGGLFLEGAPEGVVCPQCGTCLDYTYAPETLWSPGPLKNYDVTATYDLRLVVSENFVKIFKLDGASRDVLFKVFRNVPKMYYILPNRILKCDPAKRNTRFERPCPICGSFESIIGATPAFLRGTDLPEKGFFRTDLAFGSGRRKFPLIIVDEETARSFKARRVTGFALQPAIFES